MKLNQEIVNRINQVAVEFITGSLNEPLVEAIQRIDELLSSVKLSEETSNFRNYEFEDENYWIEIVISQDFTSLTFNDFVLKKEFTISM